MVCSRGCSTNLDGVFSGVLHLEAERWVLPMNFLEELDLDGVLIDWSTVFVPQLHPLCQLHGLQKLLILSQ